MRFLKPGNESIVSCFKTATAIIGGSPTSERTLSGIGGWLQDGSSKCVRSQTP